MIRSMTGYGEASDHVDGVHYFLEVRSLNNKYFKATIRLPEDIAGLEPELEAELRRRLTRGTITLTARTSSATSDAAYTINHLALSHYIDQIKKTPQVAAGAVNIDIAALLDLPGVLQPPADEERRLEAARRAFAKLLERVLADLIKSREREGRGLVDDVMQHHDLIKSNLVKIAARAPSVVEEYRVRLQTRVEQLLREAGATTQPGDLIREVAVFADKSDINEEIQRLTAHLDQFRSMVNAHDDKPVGRTLDFVTQEMLREANTIASKSGDADISRACVEIKGAIDRIKEQVQNIE